MDPKVNLKKLEVNDGALDVKIECAEIVSFYAKHMKELFDSVKGADNYYTVTMKFAGDDKAYTLTFQRHPGKTPGQIYDERIQELEAKLKEVGDGQGVQESVHDAVSDAVSEGVNDAVISTKITLPRDFKRGEEIDFHIHMETP